MEEDDETEAGAGAARELEISAESRAGEPGTTERMAVGLGEPEDVPEEEAPGAGSVVLLPEVAGDIWEEKKSENEIE